MLYATCYYNIIENIKRDTCSNVGVFYIQNILTYI